MNPRALVLLLAICALAARLYCAATTVGTSDVALFWKFAHTIQREGLLAMYRQTEFFNHTPLAGWFAEAALALARGEQRLFAFYLRLPAIFAEFFAVLALVAWRKKTDRPAWWALAIFAASPVAFMVSGYHGNVDSVMALGVLFAALACAAQRPALCGLFLGFACNIKIIPLLLAPAFFFLWWHRGQSARFTVAATITVLAGWAYPLLTLPAVFLKNVLGYGGFWGVWGVTYLLRFTGLPALREMAFTDASAAQSAIMFGLKALIVGAALALAWRRRAVEPAGIFHTLTLTWAVFFVFAPGFGAQYLAWLAPTLLVSSERWYAAITAASSIALFVFYTVISHGLPWDIGFTVHSLASQWAGWLLLPWLVLVAFLGWHVRAALTVRTRE